MKRKVKVLGLIIASGLIFTACNKSPEEKAAKVVKVVSHKLDLNDAQTKKAEAVKDEILKIFKERKANRGDRIGRVKSLILSNSLDEDVVKGMMKDRQELMETNFPRVFPLVKEFHASLSTEQKKEMVELLEKFNKKMKKHW